MTCKNGGKPIGLGIIGCGGQGLTLVSQLRGNPRCQLLAVHDVDTAKSRRVATSYDAVTVRVCISLEELLADSRIDAVIDCTPPAFHERHVREALGAGKHVLVEKPMSSNRQQADRMLAAARTFPNQVVLHGAALLALSPAVTAAREWVLGGRLGGLWEARIDYTHTHSPQGWFVQKSIAGGGALIDLFPHPATVLFHLVNPQSNVEAASFVMPTGAEVEHLARLRLRHSDGYPITVTTAWNAHSTRSRVVLIGCKGTLTIELFDQQARLCEPFGRNLAAIAASESFDRHYQRLIEHFLDSLEDPSLVRIGDIETAYHIQSLIAEAYSQGTYFAN